MTVSYLTTTIGDLEPGDEVKMPSPHGGEFPAVVLSRSSRHPRYRGLALVCWVFPNGHPMFPEMKFSVDALHPYMKIEARNRLPRERLEYFEDVLKEVLK